MDKDGNLISSKEEVKRRWTEHFKEVLNREEPANPIIIMMAMALNSRT